LGWGYRGHDDFERRAAEFLADGIRLRQHVEFVGAGDEAALLQWLESLPGGDRAVAGGLATVTRLDDALVLDLEGAVVPGASADRWAKSVEDALGRGFAGLRRIVDATSLARTPEHRDALAEYEHLVDRLAAVQPAGALCGYDLDELGEAANELVCVHPLTDPTSGPFRLFATSQGHVAIAGDLDLATRRLFAGTVTRLLPRLDADPLVIDLSGVGYVEHNALTALERVARERGISIALHNVDQVIAQVVDLLGLRHVQLER
jgi:anti-anti-sigma factor